MKQKIIDYLKATLGLTDEEATDFLKDFFESFDQCCAQLQTQLSPAEPDYGILRFVAHTLTGFCDNMGAVDISVLARELSAAAKQGDAANCKAKIAEILQLNQNYHK